ncbi:hypothetical protein M8818_003832 [Zalaria obscura]|uniref:Uncharacterized protein n=1 Tax=Zalaria obscura TaxID=2024903 RepID=A0ACC3SFI2_9PEZI
MPSRLSTSNHPDSVRMLVFETDTPTPDTHKSQGSFGDIFDKLFKTAGDNHDPPLGIETAMRYVVESDGGSIPTLSELDDVHAILITGSCFDAHGDDAWILKLMDLLRDVWTKRPDIRLSGVCFGHQILCRMLGSRVDSTPDGEWELAHTAIDLNEIGKKLFRTDKEVLHLHQMHQDHVVDAPSAESSDGLLGPKTKVHVWGSTESTEVQGVYIRDRLFTSQGHLGFDENMVKRQIEVRQESGSIDDHAAAEARKETAGLEHDGEVVAAAILRLFHGDDVDIP